MENKRNTLVSINKHVSMKLKCLKCKYEAEMAETYWMKEFKERLLEIQRMWEQAASHKKDRSAV